MYKILLAINRFFGFLALLILSGATSIAQAAWQTIHNDFYWYDQNGNPIRTRSGDLRKFGTTYFWYGGAGGLRHQTCYTSTDLVHWTYRGIVLSCPVETNRVDVLYNAPTQQYVMVMKYDGNGAHLGIATSKVPDGAFTFKDQSLLDSALMGDMSVYTDADGNAYLAAVSWKAGTNAQHGIWLLSPEYLTVARRIFLWNRGGREAPMMFKRNGTYYYATSQTANITSTSTQYYSATNLEGPWSALTPMPMGGSTNSWDSQCDFVCFFKGTRDSTYMYCGDRWVKPDESRQGDYVWLPMTFNGNTPVVNYYQDWDINLETGQWRVFDLSRNLSMHRTATASSVNGSNAASNVTDSATYLNFANTRWESAASDPQWIMVDLGSEKEVNRVILKWHENFARSFKIQVSANASTWRDMYSTTTGTRRSVTDVTFEKTSARYVRMYGTQRGTSNGYSLFEFMVLNDDVETGSIPKDSKTVFPLKACFLHENGSVSYILPFSMHVKLELYDVRGKLMELLANGYQCAGRHTVIIPTGMGKGLYLLRLKAGGKPIATVYFESAK